MSEKVELTITFPSFEPVDSSGYYWQAFDLTEAFERGENGLRCRECGNDTWRGWSKRIDRENERYEFLCPACVNLINPLDPWGTIVE